MLKRWFRAFARLVSRHGWSMQTKLVVIFLLAKVLPLFVLLFIAWRQFVYLGDNLRTIAVNDSTASLNDSAVKNIERMSTDTALRVADFLYGRDMDILHVAGMEPTEENFQSYVDNMRQRLIRQGKWELARDGMSWVDAEKPVPDATAASSNPENNWNGGFHSIPPESFEYDLVPLYDEITFIDLDGNEIVKAVSGDSPKKRHRLTPDKRDVSRRENTFVRAEDYFPRLKDLRPGEIYVSDVIGAYVGTNYIGMYVPSVVEKAAGERGYGIDYKPEEQAYSGVENPVGQRFEGIVRWATPVAGADGEVRGYVTLALNHDHIMEFVDHITPMDERYSELPSAFDGNYAFIWDYKCRSICHPRHHSIVGFDPETGEPEVPWLEASIYDGWKKSGVPKWTDYIKDYPLFHEQSRDKRPAAELTKNGFVGLDGRYLNNAPQCTGWMDLTLGGGSGSFYILWSGLEKLNTAAAIPYYTGQYAPSEANNFSKRGFGFVAIGSGLDYFTAPAAETGKRLEASISTNMRGTIASLVTTTAILTIIVIFIAVLMAWNISRPIKRMAWHMSRLAIGDIADDDVPQSAQNRRDEIGILARSLHDLILSRRDELRLMNSIATGDYTRSIPLRSDLDLLGKALNTMVRFNKNALSQVSRAVERVDNDATSVSDASASLAQGVETSESVLGQISDIITTVDSQARDNALHAEGANQLAAASRGAAERGYRAVTEIASSMSEIRQAGTKIAAIVKLIDDIAFQTNLLALNAAVEAARAGRHGRGFSVVADEVRNLSARSAKAAHESAEMIAAMQILMESGASLAEHSDREFRDIVDTTAQVAQIFESIVAASNEQSSATSSIVHSLQQIAAVTQENSENAKQMSGSAGALSRQAEELRRMVSRFRLGASTRRRPEQTLPLERKEQNGAGTEFFSRG